VAQVVKHLPGKSEALNTNSSTIQTKEAQQNERNGTRWLLYANEQEKVGKKTPRRWG
jgi:hypothetical protein